MTGNVPLTGNPSDTALIYRFGDCELDTGRMELRRDGKPVAVQPQVFDLMVLFVENPGRLLTRDDIVDRVWKGRIVSEAAISSRIKAARKAVGDTGHEQKFIKTLHGRGFRFVGEVTTDAVEKSTDISDEPRSAPARGLRPSIAVLPFENQSRSQDLDYLADGVAGEISVLLSRLRWLKVLAYESGRVLQALQETGKTSAPALEVGYILKGTVQQSPNKLRVAVRLINAAEGEQVWSEVYDRELADVFELQDEIALSVAAALGSELEEFESMLAARKTPSSLSAWDYWLRGRSRMLSFTREGLTEAKALFRAAAEVEPDFALAHSGLAYVDIQNAFYGDPANRDSAIREAVASALRAVEIDNRDPASHFTLGRAYSLRCEAEKALDQLDRAVRLNPSFAHAHLAIGFTLVNNRRPQDALSHIRRFEELSPWDPHAWTNQHMHAFAHYWLGDLESAESMVRRAISQANATWWPHATLVSILGSAGKSDAAGRELKDLLARKPDYTLEIARGELFFLDDPENEARFLEGLRAAGLG